MIYVIILIVLICMLLYFTVMKSKRKTRKRVSNLTAFMMFILSMVRYGSGSDYFAYQYHYIYCPKNIYYAFTIYDPHLDIGYKALICLFKSLGLEFEVFIAVISFFTLLLCFIAIYKLSDNTFMSLFMFFTVYYQIYVNSALRQGIAMALFFLVIYIIIEKDDISRKKRMKYCFGILLFACLFHKSALITLGIFVIYRYSKKICANIDLLLIIAVIVSICSLLNIPSIIIFKVFSILGMDDNLGEASNNIFAIGLRATYLIIAIILYKLCKTKINDKEKFLLSVYAIGMILYFGVSGFSLLSRLTEYFSILEVILFPCLIKKLDSKSIKVAITFFVAVVCSVLFIKDIASFLVQGNYFVEKVTEYPFVTIFNEEDIDLYRSDKYRDIIIGKKN